MTCPSPALRRSRRAVVALALCGVGTAGLLGLAPVAHATPAQPVAGRSGGLDPSSQQRATSMMPADSPDGVHAVRARALAPHAALAPSSLQAYGSSDLRGVDIASYQHPGGAGISWPAVRASGISFAFVKASESTGYRNPYYAGDVHAAQAAGITTGAYHFAQPAYSAIAQADNFAATLRTATPALPPVLDLEQTGGLSVAALQAWTASFLGRVRSDLGVTPMIYTGPYFWQSAMGASTAFTGYPLWIAHYTTAAAPSSPGGWSAWTFWQWTDGAYFAPGPVPGIAATVDRDRFAGSVPQLAVLATGQLGRWMSVAGAAILGVPLTGQQQLTYAYELGHGTSKAAQAARLEQFPSALGADALADYQRILRRSASSAELGHWVAERSAGLSKVGEVTEMAASAEFYGNEGHGTPSGFVSALYTNILGRPGSAGEIAGQTAHLTAGLPPAQLVQAFERSAEGHGHEITLAYQRVLRRGADPAGQASDARLDLAQPAAWPGLLGALYASQEYTVRFAG